MQNKFVIIAPFYNQGKNIEQFLASIYYQTYSDWKIILLDDLSDDNSYYKLLEFCKNNKINLCEIDGEDQILQSPKSDSAFKIFYVKNKNKLWEVENILNALKICHNNDIILRIDPDDFLFNLMSLEILNNAYNGHGAEAIWTSHVWKGSYRNISGPMPSNADVYKHPWVSSHLKSFRKYLINDVKDENFRRWDGKYFTRIGDQAIYLPVLHNTNKKGFLDIPMYWYNIEDKPETYQTDDAKLQKQECDFLRARGYI